MLQGLSPIKSLIQWDLDLTIQKTIIKKGGFNIKIQNYV